VTVNTTYGVPADSLIISKADPLSFLTHFVGFLHHFVGKYKPIHYYPLFIILLTYNQSTITLNTNTSNPINTRLIGILNVK